MRIDADGGLIHKMKQGDDEAFASFVRKYYEEVLKYCTCHCFDREYAKDITQETFVRFFAHIGSYTYRGKTKNYLYTIAGNLCRNYYSKTREIAAAEPMDDKTAYQASPGSLPEDALDRMMVERALRQLPRELYDVIVLYYFQELKLREIADILHIGLPLVKYRVRQARKQLEKLLRKEDFYEFG